MLTASRGHRLSMLSNSTHWILRCVSPLSLSFPRSPLSRNKSNLAPVVRVLTNTKHQCRFDLRRQTAINKSGNAVATNGVRASLFLGTALGQYVPPLAPDRVQLAGQGPIQQGNGLPAVAFSICANTEHPVGRQRRCPTSKFIHVDTAWRRHGITQPFCIVTASGALQFHSHSSLDGTQTPHTTRPSLHSFTALPKSRRSLTTSGKESQHSTRIMTIPNLICVARIIATPWICVLVVQGQFQTAFFAFVAAGISDGLDGYIARNFDQVRGRSK